MKTLTRIQGYVMNANVFEPHWKWGDEAPKYELYLTPYDSYEFYTLEDRIEQLKQEHKYSKTQSFLTLESAATLTLTDRIIYGTQIKFESLLAPKLEGNLSDLTHDHELQYKFVQVVGHLQIQDLGNCFLSFHIVESAVHPAEGFDA